MTLPDPRHHWPFVEGSGTQATDIAWGARMTMSRESWGPGKRGRALRFAPAEGALHVTTSCPDREPPWTAAMWIRREADSESATLLSSKSFALKLEQYYSQHNIGITRFGDSDRSSACQTPLGEWVHLAFVGTERDTTVYVNGEPQATFEEPAVSLPLGWVGSTEGYADFGAFSLEELQIFHEALTAEQLVELGQKLPRPVTLIEGVVNQYAAVTQISGEKITLGSASDGFKLQPDDQVLLVQMAGASVDLSSSDPKQYGKITDLGCTGRHAWGVVSAVSATSVTLSQPVADGQFDPLKGKVQLVRAFYSAEDVTVKGPVKALAWNGELGGVIAIITEGTLSLGADVDASGQGFPGGLFGESGRAPDTEASSLLAYGHVARSAGRKGAGLAALEADGAVGRGAVASGGGGGNSFVGGGGGGGHGGPGGEGSSYCTESDKGGAGGHLLSVSDADRIFMGGGGGGGSVSAQPQPESSGSGGGGGGIVLVRARCVAGSAGACIRASGSNAERAYDGGGGGGAGGTILLVAQEVRGAFGLEARGGAGASNHSYASADGAGGGGGGGVIRASIPLPAALSWSVEGGKGGRNANTASDGGEGVMVTP